MIILKTALVLLVFLARGQQEKPYGCSNLEMVQLIGDDPLPFTVKERWIEYSDGVRFAHTNHG